MISVRVAKKIKSYFIGSSIFNKIIKQSSILIIGDLISTIFSFISLSLLLNYLSPSVYGSVILVNGYVMLIDSIVNFQTWQALIKYGSKELSVSNKLGFMQIIKSSFIVDTLTAILGSFLAILFSEIAVKLIGIESEYLGYIRLYSIVLCFHITGMPTGVLRLLDKFKIITIQKIFSTIIKFFLIVLFVISKMSMENAFLLYMLIDLVNYLSLIICSLVVLKREGYGHWISTRVNFNKEFIKFVIHTNLSSTVNVPVKKLDIFFISSFLSVEMVAFYKFINQMAGYIDIIVQSIYKTIYPQQARLIAEQNYSEAVDITKKVFYIIISMIIPVMVLSPLLLESIINLFFGEFYSSNWFLLMIYFIVNILIHSFIGIHPLFISMGYDRLNLVYTVISNAIYLLVLYILIIRLGIMGVIISILIQSVLLIVPKLFTIKRELNMRWRYKR